MNKKIFTLVVCLLAFALSAFSQYSSQELSLNTSFQDEQQSQVVKFDLQEEYLYSWALRVDGLNNTEDVQFKYRYRYAEENWSEKQPIGPDYDLMDRDGKWMSELRFLDENATDEYESISMEIFMSNATFAKAEIQFIEVNLKDRLQPSEMVEKRANCEKPDMLTREDWCAGNCPPMQEAAPTHQEFLIVHHSASANTSSNWAAVVESFYRHHVNGNGWDDIGYNWLIDPDGVVYVGRGDEKLGAHFCAQNQETAGICVIGTFSAVEPTELAMESLKKLLGWKVEKENLNPTEKAYHASSGEIIPRITGHRIACSTECPGSKLFALLQDFPSIVDDYVKNCGEISAEIILKANLFQDASVQLIWESNKEVGSWDIYRQEVDGNYEKLASVAGDTDKWRDKSLNYGKRYSYYVAAENENIESNEVSVLAAIDNIEAGHAIYPNPVTENLSVVLVDASRGELKVEFYDVQGQRILPGGSEISWNKDSPILKRNIDMSALQAGVYFMKIDGNGLEIREKIIVH